MNELSLEKKAKVLAAFKTMYRSSKKGVKDFASTAKGSNIAAEKSAVETAKSAKDALGSSKNMGRNAAKKNAKKHRSFQGTIDRGPGKIEGATAATSKARKQLAIGATGAVITAAALRAAMKSGSKTTLSSLTKRQKLIKALKKNPKTTAAIGAGSGVGLAALLS